MSRKNYTPHNTVILVSMFAFAATIVYHLVAGIMFDRDYSGHLKRAADANSLKLAEQELKIAVSYLQSRHLDSPGGRNLGQIDDHTSMFWSTPDEQISFHYDNVVTALAEVQSVLTKGEAATPLERSNVLMKLRETLLDNTREGVKVTYPQGLDVYPSNLPIFLLLVGSSLLFCVGLFFRFRK